MQLNPSRFRLVSKAKQNNLDVFCYICGEFTKLFDKKKIDGLFDSLHHACFGIKLGDQGQFWASHIVCKPAPRIFFSFNGKRNSLKFRVPMIWHEPQNNHNDCYFCAFDLVGLNKRTKKSTKFSYPSLKSAIFPVVHSDDILMLVFQKSLLLMLDLDKYGE